MSLSLARSERFDADFELQYRWYLEHAGEKVATRFLNAVQHTLHTLLEQPDLGRPRSFRHPALRDLRSARVRPPFHKLLIFYRTSPDNLQAWRLMHGARDLPRRLVQPPGPGV
jgi:toxin ParE1/3/4